MTVPSLADRVVLITGANTGIGKATAVEIARAGATVILACRSRRKAEDAIIDIRKETDNGELEILELDLANFASIRDAAAKFLDSGRPLHVLINNAGLAGPRGLTEDGFELTFGVNHLGHYLLTRLLLDKLRESAPSRIVNVSSQAHFGADGIDYDAVQKTTKSTTGYPEYRVSKLANVWFTKSLDKRLEGSGVSTYALHPGVIASDVWRRVPWPFRHIMKWFMKSTEDGAKTSIYCATEPSIADESGKYYDEEREKKPSDLAFDERLAEELWQKSAEFTGLSPG